MFQEILHSNLQQNFLDTQVSLNGLNGIYSKVHFKPDMYHHVLLYNPSVRSHSILHKLFQDLLSEPHLGLTLVSPSLQGGSFQ